MRTRLVDAALAIYERLTESGVLARPRARRAFESGYLAYKSLIEAGPVSRLAPVVAPGSVVIDVGANIGFFALRFARWTGPTGRVIAIEPESKNVATLRRRVASAGLADTIECVQAAASDAPGEVLLALNPVHPGDHHISDEGTPIRAVTLDELVADEPRPVSLIKVDVQGAEMLVLAGARSLLERDRPAIFIEVDDPSLVRLGTSARELITTIADLGYAGHLLTRGGIGPAETVDSLAARVDVHYIDILFLPVPAPAAVTA